MIILMCLVHTKASSQAMHRLTEKDRQNYVLSINQSVIKLTPKPVYLFKQKADITCAAVPVKLENKTSKILTYTNMSCEWSIIYTTNNKNISIIGWPCDSNYPVLLKVAPHSASVVNLPVYFKKSGKKQKFKIGMMLYANDDNILNFTSYNLRAQSNSLIWSNEVTTP